MTVATLAGWLLITPTMASENWKADAEKWKAEAKKWEAIAKRYEDRYGWINDKYGWCSLNRSLNVDLHSKLIHMNACSRLTLILVGIVY